MKKRIFGILLCCVMVLGTLSVAILAEGAAKPAKETLYKIYEEFVFFPLAYGADGGFFGKGKNVDDGTAHKWAMRKMPESFEQYAGPDGEIYTIPYEVYINHVDSLFEIHSDMKEYLMKWHKYDEATGMVIIDTRGGLGGVCQWEVTNLYEDGDYYHVKGLYLEGIFGETMEDVTDSMVSYIDYYPATYLDMGLVNMGIAYATELTLVNTDAGLKIVSYEKKTIIRLLMVVFIVI